MKNTAMKHPPNASLHHKNDSNLRSQGVLALVIWLVVGMFQVNQSTAREWPLTAKFSRDGSSKFVDQSQEGPGFFKRFTYRYTANGIAPICGIDYEVKEEYSWLDPETGVWSAFEEHESTRTSVNVSASGSTQTITIEQVDYNGDISTTTLELNDGYCPGISVLSRECADYGAEVGIGDWFKTFVASATDMWAYNMTLTEYVSDGYLIGGGFWRTNWPNQTTLQIIGNNTIYDYVTETLPTENIWVNGQVVIGYGWWIHDPTTALQSLYYNQAPAGAATYTWGSVRPPYYIRCSAPAGTNPYYKQFLPNFSARAFDSQ